MELQPSTCKGEACAPDSWRCFNENLNLAYMFLSFSFPRSVDSGIAGPEGAKNLAGNVLRLIQIRLNDGRVRVVGPWDFSRTFLCLRCVA